MAQKFSLDIAKELDRASQIFVKHLTVWLVAGMVMYVAAIVLVGLGSLLSSIPFIGWLLGIGVMFVLAGLMGVLFVGLLGMARDAFDSKTPELERLFDAIGPALFPTAVASIVIAIATEIGMFFCLLPGLFVAAIYLHTWLFLEEGERDFWAAMEKSRKLVFDDFPQWLLVFAVVFCIKLAGFLVCTIGLIPAVPFLALFLAAIYDAAGLPGGAAVATEYETAPVEDEPLDDTPPPAL